MRIAAFAHNLTSAGVKSVGLNLLRQLADAGQAHEFLAIVPPDDDYRAIPTSPSFTLMEREFRGVRDRLQWELVSARQIAEDFEADWVVALGSIPIVSSGFKSAVLIHDPHLFYDPAEYRFEDRRLRVRKHVLRSLVRRRIQRVDVTLVQTTVARNRMQEMYGIDQLEIIPNAVSELVEPQSDVRQFDVGGSPTAFRFLTLTRYYPHKNLELLIEMFRAHGSLLEGVSGVLTIEGTQHPRAARLLETISRLGLEDQLVNVGPVDQRRLASLYQSVDALVLPTLLESYSATYIEAMKFEVPVITSDKDFAHEVCRSAAAYFDPSDPLALAKLIRQVADDAEFRKTLIIEGRKRLGQLTHSWADSAKKLIQVLDKAS